MVNVDVVCLFVLCIPTNQMVDGWLMKKNERPSKESHPSFPRHPADVNSSFAKIRIITTFAMIF